MRIGWLPWVGVGTALVAASVSQSFGYAFGELALAQFDQRSGRLGARDARLAIAAAVRASPYDANLRVFRAMILRADCESTPDACVKMAASLEKGVALRPNSVRAWTLLAAAYAQIFPDPNKALQAVRTALYFGPRDIPAAFAAVEIGLNNWTRLDANERQATESALAMVFPHAAQRIVGVAENLGDTPWLDPLLHRVGIANSFREAREVYRKDIERQRE